MQQASFTFDSIHRGMNALNLCTVAVFPVTQNQIPQSKLHFAIFFSEEIYLSSSQKEKGGRFPSEERHLSGNLMTNLDPESCRWSLRQSLKKLSIERQCRLQLAKCVADIVRHMLWRGCKKFRVEIQLIRTYHDEIFDGETVTGSGDALVIVEKEEDGREGTEMEDESGDHDDGDNNSNNSSSTASADNQQRINKTGSGDNEKLPSDDADIQEITEKDGSGDDGNLNAGKGSGTTDSDDYESCCDVCDCSEESCELCFFQVQHYCDY